MNLRWCIVISTSLLLASAIYKEPEDACTSYTDLSMPCGCALSEETFDPQCGSDGQTYLNPCFFECRRQVDRVDITIKHEGVCEHEYKCECRAVYNPVCGNNGVTYSNECTLKCSAVKDSSIRLKHTGLCEDVKQGLQNKETKEENKCPDVGGKCQKKKNREKLRTQSSEYRYPDDTPEHEREFHRPSSEFFVQPFSIEKHIKNHNHHIFFDSHEPIKPKRRCVCAEVHRPVCANDHKTYANFCVFFCSTKKDVTLKFNHWGVCTQSDEENGSNNRKCVCADVHRPVCANNWKTYPNFCVFVCDLQKDPLLNFFRWGECPADYTKKRKTGKK